jgi:hypothetical protein
MGLRIAKWLMVVRTHWVTKSQTIEMNEIIARQLSSIRNPQSHYFFPPDIWESIEAEPPP